MFTDVQYRPHKTYRSIYTKFNEEYELRLIDPVNTLQTSIHCSRVQIYGHQSTEPV